MAMKRVLVADDHPMCAAAVKMATHAVDQAIMVETVATLGGVEQALQTEAVDLVLLDLMLPDVEGFAGLSLVRAMRPAIPVAIVSSRDELPIVRQAAQLGASGFISKSLEIDRMVDAIRVLLTGGQWFPDGVLTDADPLDPVVARIGELSVAQLRVLRAAASGRQNKQIAFDLELAEPTVKSHLAAAFRKLGVTNRTQAVLAYRRILPD